MSKVDWEKRQMQLDSVKRSNVGNPEGSLNHIQVPLTKVSIYNEKLANLKTIVNNLLAQLQEGKLLFYHNRDFSVEQIASSLLNLTAENFNRKMAKLKRNASLEHSQLQSEIILFLKNKRLFEGKPELLDDRDTEDYDEEFVIEFNEAKKWLPPVNTTTGETVNLEGGLSLEGVPESKEGGNVSLSVVNNGGSVDVSQIKIEGNIGMEYSEGNLKTA